MFWIGFNKGRFSESFFAKRHAPLNCSSKVSDSCFKKVPCKGANGFGSVGTGVGWAEGSTGGSIRCFDNKFIGYGRKSPLLPKKYDLTVPFKFEMSTRVLDEFRYDSISSGTWKIHFLLSMWNT